MTDDDLQFLFQIPCTGSYEKTGSTIIPFLFLVDKDRVRDAYRAYGYFRWLNDRLDQVALDRPARIAFVARQQTLIEHCYRGDRPRHLSDEEELLVNLIHSDTEQYSELQIYIRPTANAVALPWMMMALVLSSRLFDPSAPVLRVPNGWRLTVDIVQS